MVVSEEAGVVLVAAGLDGPIPAGPPTMTPNIPVTGAGAPLPPAAPGAVATAGPVVGPGFAIPFRPSPTLSTLGRFKDIKYMFHVSNALFTVLAPGRPFDARIRLAIANFSLLLLLYHSVNVLTSQGSLATDLENNDPWAAQW